MHILVVTGGPKLGDLEAGVVAQLTTPTISVVSGGVACMIGAGLLAVLVPELDRYRTDEATASSDAEPVELTRAGPASSEGGGADGRGVVAEEGVGPGDGAG